MTISEINNKIKHDEYKGEKLINYFRFSLTVLYIFVYIFFIILRKINDVSLFPAYSFIPYIILVLFSVFLFFYFRKKSSLHPSLKYIFAAIDMIILSVVILVGCTYPELDPPIVNLSIWGLFYYVLILLGAFRYSTPCAVFSGIFGGICYFLVVFLCRNTLDLPYFYVIEDRTISVNFPVFNETFRSIGMIITGIITAMACKRHLNLFNDMIEAENEAAQNNADTVIKIFSMSKTIKKSTDAIFHSSKDIFATANEQADSIQEIEATIKENAQIANEISEKTQEVAGIAGKMENDVMLGFDVLGKNVSQLEEIKKENEEVITGIIELGSKLEIIRDFIYSIEDITEQTKIIAFNAGLEAAGAGEYGKRFSVVAKEVNHLADDISSLTKQIRNRADEIHNSSSSLVESGKKSHEKISLGNNLIKELENIFMDIKTGAKITASGAQTISVSTQKQQKSTEHINAAISDISKGLSNFIQSTRTATGSAEELTEMIKKLDSILKDNA